MALLIKGGRLIDPASGRDEELDILIEEGKIGKIARDIRALGLSMLQGKWSAQAS